MLLLRLEGWRRVVGDIVVRRAGGITHHVVRHEKYNYKSSVLASLTISQTLILTYLLLIIALPRIKRPKYEKKDVGWVVMAVIMR